MAHGRDMMFFATAGNQMETDIGCAAFETCLKDWLSLMSFPYVKIGSLLRVLSLSLSTCVFEIVKEIVAMQATTESE